MRTRSESPFAWPRARQRRVERRGHAGQLLGDLPERLASSLVGCARGAADPGRMAALLADPVGTEDSPPATSGAVAAYSDGSAPSASLWPSNRLPTFISGLRSSRWAHAGPRGLQVRRRVAGVGRGRDQAGAGDGRAPGQLRREQQVRELRAPVGGPARVALLQLRSSKSIFPAGGRCCDRDDAGAAAARSLSSSRPVSAKWPRWLVPSWSSKPSAVSRRGGAMTPALLTSESSGARPRPRGCARPSEVAEVELDDLERRPGVDGSRARRSARRGATADQDGRSGARRRASPSATRGRCWPRVDERRRRSDRDVGGRPLALIAAPW